MTNAIEKLLFSRRWLVLAVFTILTLVMGWFATGLRIDAGFTLAAGVATWIGAPLKFQADMGTVLTFVFLVNMIGAVILLPALGAWLIRPKRKSAPE